MRIGANSLSSCLLLATCLALAANCGGESRPRSSGPGGEAASGGAGGTDSTGGAAGEGQAGSTTGGTGATTATGGTAGTTATGGTGGDGGAAGQGPTITIPDPPRLTGPDAGAEVFGRIEVTGTGEPGASVTVRVLAGTQEVGIATGTVRASGQFALEVIYSGPGDGLPLTLSVTLSNAAGESPETTVTVTHSAPFTIIGAVSQSEGNLGGTVAYVRLYDSSDPADLINHIAEVRLDVPDNMELGSVPFTIPVAAGTYYLRAFRDSGGPDYGPPDAQPTLDTDAQMGLYQVVVTGDSGGHNLTLFDRTNYSDYYSGFDARTNFEDVEARPPSYRVGDQEILGEGLCRGYYLDLYARRDGSSMSLTAPRVRTPDGGVVTLLDDGGCSDDVHDNTSSSYDWNAGDGDFVYGIPDPTDAHAGDYALYYVQTQDDFAHIEVDNIAQVVKLPFLREITSPSSADTVSDLNLTVSWQAVPRAAAYDVRIDQQGGGYSNSGDTTVTSRSYTVTDPLIDDACYRIEIWAYDADPRGGDVDAHSRGSTYNFCTDVDGAQTIIVSGNIINLTGQDAPIVIEVIADDNWNQVTTARLPAGSTSYSVAVLAATQAGQGRVEAFMDFAGSGSNDSPENKPYEAELHDLDLTISGQFDLRFTPPILLVSPARGATTSDTTPVFVWQDYASTAGAAAPSEPYVQALFISDPAIDFPGTIIGVAPGIASVDLGNLPGPTEHVDAMVMFGCVMSGGTYSLDTSGTPSCVGGPVAESRLMLTPGVTYEWGVVMISCSYPDFSSQSSVDSFVTCINGIAPDESSFYAQSEERQLTIE